MATEGKGGSGLGMIRGDNLLADFIFNDETQRRVIPQLAAEGWPIFLMAGRRAARAADLEAAAAERARAAQERREPPAPKRKRQGRKAAPANTTADAA